MLIMGMNKFVFKVAGEAIVKISITAVSDLFCFECLRCLLFCCGTALYM